MSVSGEIEESGGEAGFVEPLGDELFEVSVIPVQASDDAGMSITEKIIVTEISLSD